jgi:tripartite-type tricarboxylate transporter receptor subunit TctC
MRTSRSEIRTHCSSKIAARSLYRLARNSLVEGIFALVFAASAASAETIKIVVPTPAGAAPDVLARMLAEQVGRAQGLTIMIENRPGGSTVIGTEAVSPARPDGNTLLLAGTGFVINPHLRKTNYDPLTDFEPICELVSLPMVIVAKSASPYYSLADLLAAARTKPGELTLASIGPASTAHIAFEMLKRAAKVDITFVPYAGTAPAVNALMGDHVTSFFGNYADVAKQLQAGTLRALASGSPKRIEALPELPTLTELGYKIAEGEIWFGLVAPAKTPKETISRLAGWFAAALQVPQVKTKLAIQGVYPAVTCGVEFGSFLRKQFDEYRRAIREANIKAE